MKIQILIMSLLLALILAACAGNSDQTRNAPEAAQTVRVGDGAYYNIGVPEMQQMLANKDFTFVNVHIPFEGDIAGTDASIPFDQIDKNLDQLPADKNARIVLYCRSGRMSEIAAETLVGLGYTNIWNLDGGMYAWEQAGLPIER
jgi:rhodanese-related sulfurtransferase